VSNQHSLAYGTNYLNKATKKRINECEKLINGREIGGGILERMSLP